MDDVKGSNAIVAVVSVYADTLAAAKDREAQLQAAMTRLSQELGPLREESRRLRTVAPLLSLIRQCVRAESVPLTLLAQLREGLERYDRENGIAVEDADAGTET